MPKPANTNVTPTPKQSEEDKKHDIVFISKPISSYTDEARRANETGDIRLKVTFADNGWIPKIFVVQSLKYGLLRQAIFAAIRIKFLPKELDGTPMTVTKTVEYSFKIY